MKNRKFVNSILIPAFFHIALFRLLPILASLAISLMDYKPQRAENFFIFFDNYQKLFTDGVFHVALRNTMVFVLVTVPINIALSLMMATSISIQKTNRSRSFFRMMFFLPCIAPMAATAVVFQRGIYSTLDGVLNMARGLFGSSPINWLGDERYLMIAIIIFTVWADFGYNTMLFSAGLDQIPEMYYEASTLDGAGPWRQFTRITMPLLTRTFTFVTLMTLNSHFQMFAQFSILATNDGPNNSGLVLTNYIYKNAFVYKNMGYASAVSFALFVIVFSIALVQQRLNKVDWEY